MQLAGAALWHLVSFDDERAAARAYNVALREDGGAAASTLYSAPIECTVRRPAQ